MKRVNHESFVVGSEKYFTTNIAQQFFKNHSNAQSSIHNRIIPDPRIHIKRFGRPRTMRISEIRTSQKNSCLDNQNEKLNNESALRSS